MYLLECWVFLDSTEGIRLWHEHPRYWWRIQWFWVSAATGTASMHLIVFIFLYIIQRRCYSKLFFYVCLIRYILLSDPCWKPISPQRLEWASLLNQGISLCFLPSPWLSMLLAKKRHAGISLAAHMVSLIIFDAYATIYICLILYSQCLLHFQMSWPQTTNQNLCITWMMVFMELLLGSCLAISSPHPLSTR